MDSKSDHPKALLSALSRGRNLFGYVPYPDSVLEGFYKEAIANGLNVMRIFDALNDIDNVKESIRLINRLGGIADGAVCYTVDPKPEAPAKPEGFFGKLKAMFGSREEGPTPIFTDEYFVSKAKQMEALGAKIITLELAVRFLTDYLDGDRYFRVAYPEHNLVRARAQMKLVADMEAHWDEMQAIVAEEAAKRN